MEDFLNSISQGVRNGHDKQVVEVVEKALEGGISPLDILEKGLVPGIQALGKYLTSIVPRNEKCCVILHKGDCAVPNLITRDDDNED